MAQHDSDPPSVASRPQPRSVKQEREERRAKKVAALKKQQARQKRNRIITVGAASVAALGVVALVIMFVVTSARPPIIDPDRDPSAIQIDGVEAFDDLTPDHVDPQPVDYEQRYGATPPAGGAHWSQWLNCGEYETAVPNENTVHSLEHGAVWTTYDPDQVSDADLEALRDRLPDTYSVLSPYPGLPAPMVMSAWGAQIQLSGSDDPRITDFLNKYWQSPDLPEAGAPCTGGLDAEGRTA